MEKIIGLIILALAVFVFGAYTIKYFRGKKYKSTNPSGAGRFMPSEAPNKEELPTLVRDDVAPEPEDDDDENEGDGLDTLVRQ